MCRRSSSGTVVVGILEWSRHPGVNYEHTHGLLLSGRYEAATYILRVLAVLRWNTMLEIVDLVLAMAAFLAVGGECRPVAVGVSVEGGRFVGDHG